MIQYMVVFSPTPTSRANMLEFWINVGVCCRELNNFNSVMEIVSALNASSVHRLTKSWELLSKTVGFIPVTVWAFISMKWMLDFCPYSRRFFFKSSQCTRKIYHLHENIIFPYQSAKMVPLWGLSKESMIKKSHAPWIRFELLTVNNTFRRVRSSLSFIPWSLPIVHSRI